MHVKQSVIEKGDSAFVGIKLLLCENPLPPTKEAVEAAARDLPTTTYYFLAKVPNLTGDAFVAELRKRDILVKALHQPGLGEGFVRFTTSTPANNKIALDAIRQVLGVRS